MTANWRDASSRGKNEAVGTSRSLIENNRQNVTTQPPVTNDLLESGYTELQ